MFTNAKIILAKKSSFPIIQDALKRAWRNVARRCNGFFGLRQQCLSANIQYDPHKKTLLVSPYARKGSSLQGSPKQPVAVIGHNFRLL